MPRYWRELRARTSCALLLSSAQSSDVSAAAFRGGMASIIHFYQFRSNGGFQRIYDFPITTAYPGLLSKQSHGLKISEYVIWLKFWVLALCLNRAFAKWDCQPWFGVMQVQPKRSLRLVCIMPPYPSSYIQNFLQTVVYCYVCTGRLMSCTSSEDKYSKFWHSP